MPHPISHQILGVKFFGGTSREAVEEITRRGGLLVDPAAPSDDQSLSRRSLSTGLARRRSRDREFLQNRKIPDDRGEFLCRAIYDPPVKKTKHFWPSLCGSGRSTSSLARVVACGINLASSSSIGWITTAIHCIGAALGFLTGDQVHIPNWADKVYLGWLLRSLAQPRVFIPAFSGARGACRCLLERPRTSCLRSRKFRSEDEARFRDCFLLITRHLASQWRFPVFNPLW